MSSNNPLIGDISSNHTNLEKNEGGWKKEGKGVNLSIGVEGMLFSPGIFLWLASPIL